jgi:hypothetical protein
VLGRGGGSKLDTNQVTVDESSRSFPSQLQLRVNKSEPLKDKLLIRVQQNCFYNITRMPQNKVDEHIEIIDRSLQNERRRSVPKLP